MTETPEQAHRRVRIKVGVFSLLGILSVGLVTVLVNDHPFWWRPCQLVRINIEDATGLKTKSPIRSLGLQVGYLKSVELSETFVTLAICLTAPVEVLPTTRAFIRGEGFLGDKFVELKPLKYLGGATNDQDPNHKSVPLNVRANPIWIGVAALLSGPAFADDSAPPTRNVKTNVAGEHEIPVGQSAQDMQQVIGRVDDLMKEMTGLTNNLRQAFNPDDLKKVMKQLNNTLENAAKTLSPSGGLTHTAQRALGKLEDSFTQLKEIMTKINNGEGSIGKLLNDSSYADEIKKALQNLNKLLGKTTEIRFVVDVGAQRIRTYEGGRGYFRLQIWPNPSRFYLVGVSLDPRGKRSVVNTTVNNGGVETQTQTRSVEETGLILTGMLGKVFYDRFEGALGALYGDGTVSIAFKLGPNSELDALRLQNDLYVRSGESGMNYRGTIQIRPASLVFDGALGGFYVNAGIESIKTVNGRLPVFFGGGVAFDDEDIKLLFAFK